MNEDERTVEAVDGREEVEGVDTEQEVGREFGELERWDSDRDNYQEYILRRSLRVSGVIVALAVIHFTTTQYAPIVAFLEPIVGANTILAVSQVLVFVIGFTFIAGFGSIGKTLLADSRQRY